MKHLCITLVFSTIYNRVFYVHERWCGIEKMWYKNPLYIGRRPFFSRRTTLYHIIPHKTTNTMV